MATLQSLRGRKYPTIKAFAAAYGCSPTKASGILRGLYHMAMSKSMVKHLAEVLGVSFIECADACDNTFAELKGYRGDAWKRTPRTHKGIWERWRWEEELARDTMNAARSGDWTEYRRKYTEQQDQQNKQRPTERPSYALDCYSVLGISSSATATQIKQAFRAKVKAASDGNGGYRGDMHKLVQAKEQALARCR
jgi:hypothetical protein